MIRVSRVERSRQWGDDNERRRTDHAMALSIGSGEARLATRGQLDTDVRAGSEGGGRLNGATSLQPELVLSDSVREYSSRGAEAAGIESSIEVKLVESIATRESMTTGRWIFAACVAAVPWSSDATGTSRMINWIVSEQPLVMSAAVQTGARPPERWRQHATDDIGA